ncbi:MAG: metallophosphoesterase [Candidatus Aminicenantes bacterium]|nr:MAG: metallophosphoesterase [Candidatus Aminicenantes bacterium]
MIEHFSLSIQSSSCIEFTEYRKKKMIGIMADSHDNLHAVKQAIGFFKKMECDLVIHAGDFVAPFAARELENLSCPVKAVFGNCDGERQGLKKVFRSFGVIKEAPFTFNYLNLNFLLTHVHSSLKSYLASQKYDVLVFGHTHKPEMKTVGQTLLINPGETGGWVSGKNTVAILDTDPRKAEIITL